MFHPLDLPDLKTLRQVEAQANEAHVCLMLRAADRIVRWVQQHFSPLSSIECLAGSGNNGGDVIHACYGLHKLGYKVKLCLPLPPKTVEANDALRLIHCTNIPVSTSLSDERPDLYIDGLLGIGLSQAPREPFASIIQTINQNKHYILAVDCPSGLNAFTGQAFTPCIRANATLTFLSHKLGLYTADGPDLCGKIVMEDLECPEEFWPITKTQLNLPSIAPLHRLLNTHKGNFGAVTIVGGNHGMTGAGLLSARAAVHSGAGKVFLTLLSAEIAVDPLCPEIMIHNAHAPYEESKVVCIGPGLGTNQVAINTLSKALALALPLVLDADALNLLANKPNLAKLCQQRVAPTIMTPHPLEAARLLSQSPQEVQANRLLAVETLAKTFKATVLLKGNGTLICSTNSAVKLNTTGNAALSNGGQGDVLTGVIGSFIAQGLAPDIACHLAAYLHGLVADLWLEETGGTIGLCASEVINRLPALVNALLRHLR